MSFHDDDKLAKAIRVANETLAKIEQQEGNFYKTYGKHENDFLNDFISVSKYSEEIAPKQIMKRFDQLISNVNIQLQLLEAKTYSLPKNHSNQANVVRSNSSKVDETFTPKIAANEISSITEQNDSNRLAQIDNDLLQLEQRLANIEMRIQEDIEAEQIGIELPISDIIDYVTAIKVIMYKRRLLTNQFHQIVINDKQFKEETKWLKKDYAVWTKKEREDLLTKMAMLEESLNKLQRFPFVYSDEFNKYYPLMDDLGLLKRLVSQFLDKYEIDSSSATTARLTSSFSPLFQQDNSKSQTNAAKLNLMKKEVLKNVEKDKITSKEKSNQEYESDADIHTAIEKN